MAKDSGKPRKNHLHIGLNNLNNEGNGLGQWKFVTWATEDWRTSKLGRLRWANVIGGKINGDLYTICSREIEAKLVAKSPSSAVVILPM